MLAEAEISPSPLRSRSTYTLSPTRSLALLLSMYSLAYPSDCPSTPAHLSAGSPTCPLALHAFVGHVCVPGIRLARSRSACASRFMSPRRLRPAPAHSVSTTPSATVHPPSVRRPRLTVGVCLSLACSSARRLFISHACMLVIVMRRAARRRVLCLQLARSLACVCTHCDGGRLHRSARCTPVTRCLHLTAALLIRALRCQSEK
ncbi:uncharacterized protein B0H18DRAFT_1018091 [Fomitopsis serialis]|uniref:uncharacterized protein n=1 Tax=Fomitopsis serialis TaxID=139415 RepID=UPI002007B567|nr:uncharacterized protein B0H18DRAFT_1018091 [Neoantrodia serialis]KAH9922365.1 hypothetical protein B0H18DRAFT_1018091 [Neoantrodia serialis]